MEPSSTSSGSSSSFHLRDVVLHAVLASFLELQQQKQQSSPESLLVLVSQSHPTLSSRLKESSVQILQQTLILIMETISTSCGSVSSKVSHRVVDDQEGNDNYGIFQVFGNETINANDNNIHQLMMNLPIEDLLTKFVSSEQELRIIEQTCVALVVATVRQKQQQHQTSSSEEKSVSYHRGDRVLLPQEVIKENNHHHYKSPPKNQTNNNNNNHGLVSLSPPSSDGERRSENEEEEEEEEEIEILEEEEEETESEKIVEQADVVNTIDKTPELSDVQVVVNNDEEVEAQLTPIVDHHDYHEEHQEEEQKYTPFPSLLDLSHNQKRDQDQNFNDHHHEQHHSSSQSRRRLWNFNNKKENSQTKQQTPTGVVRFQDSPSKYIHDDISSTPSRRKFVFVNNNDESSNNNNNTSTIEDMMSMVAEEVADRRNSHQKERRRSWNHSIDENVTTPTPQKQKQKLNYQRTTPTPPAFAQEEEQKRIFLLREQQNQQAVNFFHEKLKIRSAQMQESTFLFWWQQTALRKCAKYLIMKRNFSRWKQALLEKQQVQQFQQTTSQQTLARLAFNKWKQKLNCKIFIAKRNISTSQKILRYWQDQANHAPLVKAFTALRAHNIASRCLHTWKVRFNVRIETRQLEQQARETLLLRHVVSRWIRKYREAKKERELRWENVEKPLLEKVMNKWVMKLYSNQAIRFAERKKMIETQKMVFGKWKQKTEEKQENEMRRIEEFDLKVKQKILMRVALDEWKRKHQMVKFQQERNAVVARKVLLGVWKSKYLMALDLKRREIKKKDENQKIGFARKMLRSGFTLPAGLQL